MRTITKISIGYFIMLFTLLTVSPVKAQVTAARTSMQNLYALYDNTPFITFDVKYTYSSDTAYNDYTHDELTGTYTMSGRKAKFTLGDVEYMQNDSLFIATYHKDKIIIISDARQAVAGGYMPLRGAIDSLLNSYAAHYTITVQDNPGDTAGFVKFTRADSLAEFSNFNIWFDKEHNAISALEYVFYENRVTDNNNLAAVDMGLRRNSLRIDFLHYRFDNFSETVYDTNNYVWTEDGVLKPSAKLDGYKVYDTR